MTVKGFIFLMLVTIGTVMIAGTVAEFFTKEGFERTIVVAVATALVVFPSARWAERKGWIKGSVRVDKMGEEFSRKRPAAKTQNQQAENRQAADPQAAATPPAKPATDGKPDGQA